MGDFYHGVAKCSRNKLCSAFFTQISKKKEKHVHVDFTSMSDLKEAFFT